MAAEKVDVPCPKPHQFESPDRRTGLLNSPAMISKSLAPLEHGEESQGELSDQHKYGGGHNEADAVGKPQQPKIGPFISRPKLEDPVNFQVDFKYTKAPAHQTLPFHPNAPQKSAFQNSSMNAIHVQTRRPLHDPGHYSSEGISSGLADTHQTETRSRETRLEVEKKKCDVMSIPSDPLSDATIPENDQPQTQEPGASRNGQLSGPPFQNSPLFNKISSPLQSKDHARSPPTKSEKPKLSKAFSDIQRKAIIQSTRMKQSGQSECLPDSQIGKASPRRLNEAREIRQTGTCQGQEESAGELVFNQQPRTPKAHTSPHDSRLHRSKASRTTRLFAQDGHKNYGVRKRPGSQASNISIPRAPRAHERSHTRRKTSPTLEESYALRNGLNQCWNRFFSYEETRNKHWEQKIEYMVEQLAERDAKLAECLAEIRMKDQTIAELKTVNEEQFALYQEQEAALADVKKHRQKLQGKMKEYKDRLNDATNEQQTIFKYFQPRYHQLRDQLKQEERSHQLALEKALAATDEIRDKMQKSVEEVRMLSQGEIRMLNQEIETLKVKLTEREKEVDREKDHINDLRRELAESHGLNRDAIKSLSTQNRELAEKGDERGIQVRNVMECVNEQGQKIQSVLKFLEDSKATMPSNADLVEDLKVLHTEALNSIISALGEYAASGREMSSKTTEDLKADISAIRESCTNLSAQIQGSHNASEWQQKFGRVQLDHQVLLRETDRLKKKLTEMREEAKIQLEKHETLQRELITLRDVNKVIGESDRRAESLEKARQEIQQSLNEREMHIRDLEDKIKKVNDALSNQNRLLKDKEEQLQSEREKHAQEIVTCYRKQEEAIQQAKKEESSRIQAGYRGIEKRLQDTEQDCSKLQKKLEEAQQSAEDSHKNKAKQDEKEMQVLESAARLINELSEDLRVSEQAKRDLNAKLEVWSSDHAETSLIKHAVQKLTADQHEAIENGKQLGELLDVQKKLDDAWQYHKSQFDALELAVESEKIDSVKIETAGHLGRNVEETLETLQDMNRRVTIQSPKISDSYELVPISIEDERAIRRQACAPKGIIKSGVVKAREQLEEQFHKTITIETEQTEGPSKRRVPNCDAKPTLVSQSAYNRPVLGTPAGVEELDSDPISGDMATWSDGISSILKRKRDEGKTDRGESAGKWERTQSTEKRRTKLSRSMSEYFHDPVAAEPRTEPTQPGPPKRGGPIERRPRPFVTYGSSSLNA